MNRFRTRRTGRRHFVESSEEVNVYKSFSDEPISLDEFVKKVREVRQELEDMLIQNIRVYSHYGLRKGWEVFWDDVCGDQSPEDALDLNYYMDSKDKSKLPADIKPYMEYDFDCGQFMYDIFESMLKVGQDPMDESSSRRARKRHG